MKYKLINSVSKKETICDKVVVDGFDYYVSDEHAVANDFALYGGHITKKIVETEWTTGDKKVIATNNPNIDVLQILEEPNETLIHQIAADLGYRMIPDDLEEGIKAGYKESQETHPFSEEDTIEFKDFCDNYKCRCKYGSFMVSSHPCKKECQNQKSTKELIQLWKEQKPKTLYYEAI